MMSPQRMQEVSQTLSDGFFADNVVKIIRSDNPVSRATIRSLQEAKEFMESIKRGKEIAMTAKLTETASEDLRSYRYFLKAIGGLRRINSTHELDATIAEAHNEIGAAIETKKIIAKKMTLALAIFEYVQHSTLSETGRLLGSPVI